MNGSAPLPLPQVTSRAIPGQDESPRLIPAPPRSTTRWQAGGSPSRIRRSGTRPILALGLCGAAALAGGLWQAHSAARLAAEDHLRAAAFAAAGEVERAVLAVEATQLTLLGWLRGAHTASLAEASRRANPPPGPLLLLDAEGQPVGPTSLAPHLLAGLAESEAFRAVRSGAARAFGDPVADAGGQPAILVMRRLEAPEGGFLGAALGMADLAGFAELRQRLALAMGGTLRLLRSDGTALPLDPPGSTETPGIDPGSPTFSAEHGLTALPLVMRAEAGPVAVLGAWRGVAAPLIGGTILLLGGFAAALRLARRRAGAALAAQAARIVAEEDAVLTAAEAAEERMRHRRELDVQGAALEATLGSMSQGLMTFGRHARLLLSNARCADLVGLPLEALRAGATFAELAAAARQAGDPGAVALLDRLLPLVVRREAASFLHVIDARRSVLVMHRPLLDGGWLATFEDASAGRATELRLRHLESHDALTGLPNAARLREALGARIAAGASHDGRDALLHVNIDRFRGVNEALGRAVGDALLRSVAARLRRLVRSGGGDIVARIGADEFVLLKAGRGEAGGDAAAEAAGVAERLVAAMGKPFEVEGYRVVTTASVGIALFPSGGGTAAEMLTSAALAMRAAKGAGRGGYAFYAPEMAEAAHHRRLAELDLRLALTEGAGRAFEVRYRPVVELPSRRITALEAGLCWNHPVYGLVEPETLLPLATELGLAAPLGRLLLRRAPAEVAPWSGMLRLSIGLSAAQLLDPGLVERVASGTAEAGLSRVEILVKEAELMGAPELMLDTIGRLRAGGVRVVLDELGGCAAMPAALRAAPFDRARLSPVLVRELGGRGHGLGIVRAISGLCAGYGIPLGASGVETEEQLGHLAAERCTQAVGPLFGAPVPAAELPALLGYAAGG